jgi:glycosyltransferase involved in cell wall biosynthesis
MRGDKVIVVVIPAYNESSQISKVVETVPGFVDHIVVVDDKSTDDTLAVVHRLKKTHPRLILIKHLSNQGVGGAIASGYKWARDNAVDVAIVMAGDGQMDPEDLPALLAPVIEDDVDYAKGNRLVYEDAYRLVPKTRFFGNAALSLLTKIASGYWHVADSQAGYTAIGRRALHAVDWDRMYKRYGQPNDLLVTLNVHNFRVRDVPVRPVYNVGETSGIRLHSVIFRISWLLLKKFLWRLKEKYVIRDFHPLVFFYVFGFLMLFLAVIFTMRLIVLWIDIGHAPELTAIAIMFLISLGFQSLFFAMWFDMEANKDLR